MDFLEAWRPVGYAIIGACGLATLFLIRKEKAKYADKSGMCTPFVGDLPMSPQQVVIEMDAETAKRKCLGGLRATQRGEGWSIMNAESDSSEFSATIRWSGQVLVPDLWACKSVKLSSNIIMNGRVIPQGRESILQWSYIAESTSWKNPGVHHTDPEAEKICIDTNFEILKSLGLIKC